MLHWILVVVVLLATVALSVIAFKHRKGQGAYLCEDCRFNDPVKCLKEVRPYASECTSYRQGVVQLSGDESKSV